MPPVAGVANERGTAPALPVLDEEGAASDRASRLGVADSVEPDSRKVLAPERMRGQDAREKPAPTGETGAKNHPDRLRVDGRDAPNLRVVLGIWLPQLLHDRANRGVGELEVSRRDRHTVAPVRFRTDVVGERVRRRGRVLDARNEVRPVRVIGGDVDAERAPKSEAHEIADVRGTGTAPQKVGIEARRLAQDGAPHDDRAAALRCLLRSAGGRRDGDHGADETGCEHERRASHHRFPPRPPRPPAAT